MADAVEHDDRVNVHVKSLVTGERVEFLMSRNATLQETWDEAYCRLDETKRDGDTFQCAGREQGKSLMQELSLTLEQAQKTRVCGEEAFRYEIKGPSGGAVHGRA
jgi:hypothetical protein